MQISRRKFSHTRYRALGSELIPVCRQSARRSLILLKSSTAVAAITFCQSCGHLPSRRTSPSFDSATLYQRTYRRRSWERRSSHNSHKALHRPTAGHFLLGGYAAYTFFGYTAWWQMHIGVSTEQLAQGCYAALSRWN